jgi:D-glycero-alpha-D-manno-heptose 1-phosphate guanylyltransferase
MEAIILAGGRGSRLSSVVSDVPKPMAPINSRPFLEIIFNQLLSQGFRRIVLSIGFKSNIISSHFGSSFKGMALEYSIEEFPLGTGGAARVALDLVRDDLVFVLNGDTYLDVDFDDVKRLGLSTGKSIIVGRVVGDAMRYGAIQTVGSLAIEYGDKTRSGAGLISAGVYLFKKCELDDFKSGERFSLEEGYLPRAVKGGNFHMYLASGKFIDIGVPDDYLRAQSYLIHV